MDCVPRLSIVAMAVVVGLAMTPPAWADQDDRAFISAEAAYRDGNHRKALSKFEDFLEDYPESPHCEAARFYAAEAARELGKVSIARRHYDALLRDYPDTHFATRARHGQAMAMAAEGRAADAVEALLAVAMELEDPADRHACYRRVVELLVEKRRFRGVLATLGRLLDDGANWREADEQLLERIVAEVATTDLRTWEEEMRGTTGGGLALYLVLQQRGLTEAAETGDPEVFLFAEEYPDHPFVGRIESLGSGTLRYPSKADRIGVILPLSGDYRRPGNDILDGLNLALQNVSAGDLKPELVIRDSEGDPEKAVAALEELVADEGVIAVIGPLLSSSALPVAEKAQELRVPTLVLSQKDGVPETGRYVFRNFLTPQAQVDAAVDYAVGHYGFRSFALFYPTTERGGAMADRFWTQVEDRECEVTAIEPYSPDDTDFRKPLRKLYGLRYMEKGIGAGDLELPYLVDRTKPQIVDGRALLLTPGEDFQAVFVPDGYKRVSMIAPGMVYEDINLADTYQTKPPVVLLGGAGLNNPEFVRRGGRYVRGSLFVDAFFAQSADPIVADFVARFEAAYQREPGLLEALAFDTAQTVLRLLGEGHTNRPNLRRALVAHEPPASVTGELGYDEGGEMQRDLLLLGVQDEGIVQIYPAPVPVDVLAPEQPAAHEPPPAEPAPIEEANP